MTKNNKLRVIQMEIYAYKNGKVDSTPLREVRLFKESILEGFSGFGVEPSGMLLLR